MDLNDVLVFAKVVQAGSFTAAARELDMPKSTVSRKVAELEECLGARLLQRTTRSLALTDVGRIFLQHATRVVAEAEEAERAVQQMQETPRGLLRVTTPLNFGFFGPIIVSFLRRYPEVTVEVVGSDRRVDLVEEGFDVAIRAGELSDSSLVTRPVGRLESYVVASPALLAREGVPREPADLARFDCLVFGAFPERDQWQLARDGKVRSVRVGARLMVNDFELLEEAARAGVGVALLPAFRCVGDLRANKLRRVLPEWCARAAKLHALYPSTRHLATKVKAFVDHVVEQMTPPPWERVSRLAGPATKARR